MEHYNGQVWLTNYLSRQKDIAFSFAVRAMSLTKFVFLPGIARPGTGAIEMQFSVLKPIILNHIGIYAFNISCKVILFHNPYLSALVTSGAGMLVYAVISSWKILNNPLGNCAVLSASFSSGVLPFKFLQAVILKAFPSAVSTLKYAVSIMLFL